MEKDKQNDSLSHPRVLRDEHLTQALHKLAGENKVVACPRTQRTRTQVSKNPTLPPTLISFHGKPLQDAG